MTLDPRISAIDRAIAAVQPLGQVPSGLRSEEQAGGQSFASILTKNLDEVIDLQNQADALQQEWSAGRVGSINDVVLAVQRADLALTFAIELRNKVIEAYQEINRMQI